MLSLNKSLMIKVVWFIELKEKEIPKYFNIRQFIKRK